MSTPEFEYRKPFPLGEDKTEYRLVTKDHVSVQEFNGNPVLVIEPEGLELLANEAMRDISFMLQHLLSSLMKLYSRYKHSGAYYQ